MSKRTTVLQFDNTEWEGAEIEVLLDIPLGDFADFLRIDDESVLSNLTDEYRWIVEKGVIVSWNLIDENENPVPIELDCMNKIPKKLATEILRRWFKSVTEVPDDLMKRLELWRALPGAPDPFHPGKIVTKPIELFIAEMVDGFCQRWGAVPSTIRGESANELFMIHKLLDEGEEQE